MQPIYNSATGKLRRPRKVKRSIGQMPKHLLNELASMNLIERTSFKIAASFAVLNLGVDILTTGR